MAPKTLHVVSERPITDDKNIYHCIIVYIINPFNWCDKSIQNIVVRVSIKKI